MISPIVWSENPMILQSGMSGLCTIMDSKHLTTLVKFVTMGQSESRWKVINKQETK